MAAHPNSRDNYLKVTRSQSENFRPPRDSFSARISPPALKRHRNAADLFINGSERSSLTLPTRSHSVSRAGQRSSLGLELRPAAEQVRHTRGSNPLKRSATVLEPPTHGQHANRVRSDLAKASDDVHSYSSSRLRSLSKGICRVCENGSTTAFNPIILCLGCNRAYHDSCRRPPLIKGIDPLHWRCSKCLHGSRRCISPTPDAPRLPKINQESLSACGSTLDAIAASFSIVKEPRFSPEPMIRGRSKITSRGAVSTRIDHHISNSASGTASIFSESIPPLGYNVAYQGPFLPESAQHDASYPSSSPNYRSYLNVVATDKLNSLIRSPDASGLSQQFKQRERAEISCACVQLPNQLITPIFEVKAQPAAAVHSECQKQGTRVHASIDSVTCQNCQRRASVVNTDIVLIHETPDIALVHSAQFHNRPQCTNIPSNVTSRLPRAGPTSSDWTLLDAAISNDKITQETEDDGRVSLAFAEAQGLTVNVGNAKDIEAVERTSVRPMDEGSRQCLSGNIPSKKRLRSQSPGSELSDHNFDNSPGLEGRIETRSSFIPFATAVGENLCTSFRDLHGESRKDGPLIASPNTKQLTSAAIAPSAAYHRLGSLSTTKAPVQWESAFPDSPRPDPVEAVKEDLIVKESKTRSLVSSRPGLDHGAIALTAKLPNFIGLYSDAAFKPFERAHTHKPRALVDFNSHVKQEKSFYSVSLHDYNSLIENMTQAEKDTKIAEIQRRRSRKVFFGRDHRLAHVRRYKRQDIHNENEDRGKSMRHRPCSDELHCEEYAETSYGGWPLSLRAAFDLPDNAIPINDGQTELAFRDGTMINGRLSRSRQIYKVGKLFGGELTVRTS